MSYNVKVFGREVLSFGRAAKPEIKTQDPEGVLSRELSGYRWGFPLTRATSDSGLRYASEDAIASRFASLKYQVGTQADGKFKPVLDHIFYELWARPNPLMSGFFFRSLVCLLILRKAGFVLVVRDALKRPSMLWPLSPLRTSARWNAKSVVEYEYQTNSGPLVFSADEVMHFRKPNPENFFGSDAPHAEAQMLTEVDSQLWDYERDMFASGVFSTWTVGYPKEYSMSAEQAVQLSRKWGERARDKERRQDPLIGTGGAEFKAFSVGNDVTAIGDIAEITERRIRNLYHTPRGVLGDTDNQPRANLEASLVIFNEMAIQPLCRLWDEEQERVLLPMYDSRLAGEFENPVPSDREFALRENEAMIRARALTPNEWRAEDGRDPIEGGDDVVQAQPASVVQIGGTGAAEPEQDDAAVVTATADVQKTALNGAQVTALQAIMLEVAAGRLSKEAAIALIILAFPAFTAEEVRAMVEAVEIKPPEPPAAPQPPPAPADDEEEEAGDEEDEEERAATRAAAPSADARRELWTAREARRLPLEERLRAALVAYFAEEEQLVEAAVREKAPRMLEIVAHCATVEAARQRYFSRDANITSQIAAVVEARKKALLTIMTPTVEQTYKTEGAKAAAEHGIAFEVNAKGIKKVAAHLDKSSDVILQTTAEKIKTTLTEGFLEGEGVDALAGRIRDLYEGMSASRAEMIARTETLYPANLGAVDAYREAGVEKKVWIATMDGNARDAHEAADGQEVALDAPFSVGGEDLQMPGDPAGSAAMTINCRCAVAGVANEGD